MSIELIARTVRGVEYVAADEIATVAPTRLSMHPREVRFSVDALTPALYELRTADDLFLVVGSVSGVGHRKDVVPWLAERASRWEWRSAVAGLTEIRDLPRRRRFDVVVSLLGRRNFSRYDVEDAMGALLGGPLEARYVSRRPPLGDVPPVDLTVRVFINADTATFALRLAGDPLHRRGYKQDTSSGTLHPPMAAVLARVTAPQAGSRVVDPFCGDGTIPIEVAALGTGAVVSASDRDPARVHNAMANAARAGADVAFSVADAGRLDVADQVIDAIVTNPPWNIAVDASGLLARGLGPFWAEAARVLSAAGRMGVIVDTELDAVGELRRLGFEIALVQSVRLAGRLSEVVLCAPPGRPRPALPAGIESWRREALAAGLVTDTGFHAGVA